MIRQRTSNPLRAAVYLVILALMAIGSDLRAGSPNAELLIGKWRDENSTVEYRADGTKIAVYDFGVKLTGKWRLENDVIKFTPDDLNQARPSEHQILQLSEDELTVKHVSTGDTYHARKVTDQK